MENFNNINLDDLEVILGGNGYGSTLHPKNWWAWFEESLKNPGKGGTGPVCDYYTPAYPGKVLPQC
ncbi:TPA: hypothetical protein ACGOYL_001151 [Streptococcus suis]|uniref:hypothetical protein n=1 Tax=Streptococcus suis TaxID=1307 RepID=UPI00040B5076|nr:hypothetical protein [Streptococcus suis]NQN92223.1 hypothetical protein [Streptococcus suis]NQP59817.1 hypothetical protein [Streptococcus suis]BCP64088.1 hypothetical protein SUT503_11460 [Streptococcus parasuis]HEM3178165.1 hypothetical protein [Streptococcus suis]